MSRTGAPDVQPLARRWLARAWTPPGDVETACKIDPRWTSDKESEWREAARICLDCPYIAECYDAATRETSPVGVWGGVRWNNSGRTPGRPV